MESNATARKKRLAKGDESRSVDKGENLHPKGAKLYRQMATLPANETPNQRSHCFNSVTKRDRHRYDMLRMSDMAAPYVASIAQLAGVSILGANGKQEVL